MTLFLTMNLDFAWGVQAGAAGNAHMLPLLGAAEWIFWISSGLSAGWQLVTY